QQEYPPHGKDRAPQSATIPQHRCHRCGRPLLAKNAYRLVQAGDRPPTDPREQPGQALGPEGGPGRPGGSPRTRWEGRWRVTTPGGNGVSLTIDATALRPLVEQVVAETLARLDEIRGTLGDRLAFGEEEAARLLGLNAH